MREPVTRESILRNEYALNGADLNNEYNNDSRWEMKNAMRELNQKRIKNNPTVMRLKRNCRINGTSNWRCPHCNKKVRRLTAAHVGEQVSIIIDRILDEHFPQSNLTELLSILRDKHEDITIVVCCDECNKILQDH